MDVRIKYFASKRMLEGHLGKDEELHAAFMHLEKAYHIRVDREAL